MRSKTRTSIWRQRSSVPGVPGSSGSPQPPTSPIAGPFSALTRHYRPPAGAESLPLPWSSERLGRLIRRPPVTTLQLATGSPSLEVLRRLQWRSSLGYGTGPSASNPGQGHPKPSETVRTESPGVGPRIGVLLCTSARRVSPSNSRNRGRSPASRQTQSGDSTIASGVPCDVTLA